MATPEERVIEAMTIKVDKDTLAQSIVDKEPESIRLAREIINLTRMQEREILRVLTYLSRETKDISTKEINAFINPLVRTNHHLKEITKEAWFDKDFLKRLRISLRIIQNNTGFANSTC